jgi:hypothetical protein
MIGWPASVRHAGVVVDSLGPVHGAWPVLMRWTGEGEPGEGRDAGT